MKYYFILILFTLQFLFATNAVWGQGESNQLYNNLKVNDGLPNNEIYEIAQDSSGFIWIATNNGFVRYDGYNMKVFRKDRRNEIALPNNQITVIKNAKDLGLWIGTFEGLIYFDTKNFQSEQIDLGGVREIRSLLNQGDSILWTGSSEGLFKINSADRSYHLYNQQNSKLGSNIIRCLYLDVDKNLWIGSFDGLNRLSPKGEMKHFNIKGVYKTELKNNLVLDIQPYSEENDSLLWLGTETGLVLFNTKTFNHKVYNIENTNFENEVVKCIFTKKPGYVYIGTDLGFYYLNTFTKEIEGSFHDPFNNYSIANNVIWDIFEDKSGILWLATSNGISKLNFNQSMFRFTPVYTQIGNSLKGTQVNDIYIDKNQSVWLATKMGVIAIHKNGEKEIFTANNRSKHPLVLNTINTISGDNLGRIWIGSSGGINIWDPKIKKMFTITADFDLNQGLRSNYISAFIMPSDGSFWVTTWGGGMYKAKGDFTRLDLLSFEYRSNFNTNIFSTSKKIWLKNENKISSIDLTTSEIETIQDLNDYIINDNVTSILATAKGYLWLGLQNSVIKYSIQNKKIEEFDIYTGNDSNILNLLEDQDGNIWGTTLTSIFKIGSIANTIETFPKNEGIPLDNFLNESKAISSDGKLFFGGNDGFISFYPNQISKNDFAPNIIITDLHVNNKLIQSVNELGGKNRSLSQISYTDKIILKYDQHSFTFEFSSLHFGDSYRNIYAYKLEGYDKDWKYTTGNKNYAAYSNLLAGKYKFKVKGSNNDGVWFDNQTELAVEINPPIWAGSFAILTYIFFLLLATFLLVITYRNKAKWKERIRAIVAEKEKNEELALSKQLFFTNISHEFRTPLSLILGPVDVLMNQNQYNDRDNQLLGFISKNAKRLLSLVNQLLDLRKIETNTLKLKPYEANIYEICRKQFELFADFAENTRINFNFKASDKSIIAWVDVPKLDSIIQNLLSNAFKFTPENGQINFYVEKINDAILKIQISDTGKGIDQEIEENIFKRFYQGTNTTSNTSGYGIGLNIAKEYCELMNGKIWFKSEVGKGTDFFVELPLSFIENASSSEDEVLDKTEVIEVIPTEKIEKPIINTNLPVILLVDDHPDTLKFLKLNLNEDYTILLANNGKEAFKVLEKQKVNLIISDIMMPELDGIEFCEKVKQNPKYENIPLILLTAKTMASQKTEGFKAGSDAYFTKPFNMEILKIQIENLIIKSQKLDEYIKRKLIVGNQEVEVESSDEKLLQETIRYINEHITETEINLKKMSHSIGVSYSSLYRKIKSLTGMSLNELTRNIKLKKAEQLVKTGKLTISEIMRETGFTNHSYFAKCFKKVYGINPRKFGGN